MANTVKGLDAVLRKLSFIEREIQRKTSEAVQEATLEVEYNAKRDAPVDLGELQQKITSSYDSSKVEGTVTAGAKHSPYIEFGTGGSVSIPEGLEGVAAKFKGKGIRTINLPARPYLMPAAKEGAKSLMSKLKQHFG